MKRKKVKIENANWLDANAIEADWLGTESIGMWAESSEVVKILTTDFAAPDNIYADELIINKTKKITPCKKS
jgi:hypothetical protein